MAIWLGVVARRAGGNWFVWGLMGAAIPIILNAIILKVGELIYGSFSDDEARAPFLIIFVIIAIVIAIVIKKWNIMSIGIRKKEIQHDNTPTLDKTTLMESNNVENRNPSFELTNCPHCNTMGVLPMNNNICPNCKKSLDALL
jgi:hypothetical protein